MKQKEVITTSGSGIATILLIVFIVLKLAGLVNWSWLWVLAPFWIPAGFAFLYLCIILVIAIIEEKKHGI
jgi:hypothetical protein